MLEELLKYLVELPGLVIQRRDTITLCHVNEVVRYGTDQDIEPGFLSKGTLHADHARQLIEQALKGSDCLVDQLGAVEVLLDHRRAVYRSMLVHHWLKDVTNPFGDRAPVGILRATIVGILLDGADPKVGEHPATVVGLAQNHLDVVSFGNTHERLERLVVMAAQEASSGSQEHPTMQRLKDGIRRLIPPPT